MSQNPPLLGDDFLHGTTALAAVQIAVEGFRLLPVGLRFWGRGALGPGIYLTRSLPWAAEFMRDFGETGGGAVLRVALAPGTRVLWAAPEHDPRVIDSLRREFGAGILKPDFPKAIPRNKHLRTRELIHLFSYLVKRAADGPFLCSFQVTGLRDVLRRAGYAGFGVLDGDLGLVVFDPARLRPLSFHRFRGSFARRHTREGRLRFTGDPKLVEAEPAKLLAMARAQLEEKARDRQEALADAEEARARGGEGAAEGMDGGEDAAERREEERASRALAAYARRHGLD